MTRILVTGGRGTVGAGLIETLLERKHQVVSCDLAHSSLDSYMRCDIGEYRQVQRLFDEYGPFDIVYNCAAEFGRWNGEDFYEQLWKTNVVGLKNILRLQEKDGFKLVHFSSSEVYGDWPHVMVESAMDEYAITQLNDYAMSKWVNEMQIRNSATQYGTQSVVVRLFNTYGPGEYYTPYRSVNCRFLYCAINGIPWTVHRGHRRTSTYLPDATRTLANIVDTFQAGETYNIGGSRLHTIEELSEIVLSVTGASTDLVTWAEPEPMTTKYKIVDVTKSLVQLNHQDTCDLETGMQTTARWMKDVYK